jgi:hypothetical protein
MVDYTFHFEGPELQAIALASQEATEFKVPYEDDYVPEVGFHVVHEGDYYIMDALRRTEGKGYLRAVHSVEDQDRIAQLGSDSVFFLVIKRRDLDAFAAGTLGLQLKVYNWDRENGYDDIGYRTYTPKHHQVVALKRKLEDLETKHQHLKREMEKLKAVCTAIGRWTAADEDATGPVNDMRHARMASRYLTAIQNAN